ncbi:AP-4 complex accessory subunit tepsin isoform X7 [Papio anubis]|uniref:AP-4 complex accessory subunit tepsin isoform X7 n=1 Tax=Papio anubis TaxID=9555 RepID=UPI000B7B8B2D|nr:AP-4 complex accessory subunit tepsin isoform X7 [Papio anubis]
MGTARPWGNEQASASIQWAPTGGKERRTQWTWSRCVRAAGAQLPILLKGTSDDDVPCPGYLFEEIAKISHESPGSSQCLLEYLLSRLHSSSGHGKLKVLKILLYLCSHGSSSFLLILKRNSAFIQEAAAFAGPPDPLHGNSLYQKVRAAAQDLGSTLFSDTVLPLAPSQPLGNPPATGMGSQARPHSTLQGFGYSKEHGRTGAGSAGEAFLSTIQKAAEVVASAMRPGPESPSTQRLLPRGDTYQPATMPSASHGPPTLGNPLPGAIPGPRAVRHQPGQAGGGWDELDSSPSSQNSSQNSDLSRVSDSGSHSGSDSHSGASREPGDLAERVEVVALSDCQQELSLVRTVTRGPRAFLSREEAQHFIKACGLLNCEVVLQLLTCHLRGTKGPVCHCLPGERRPPSPGAHPPPHPAAAAGAQHGQPGTCDQQGHQGGQLQSATHTPGSKGTAGHTLQSTATLSLPSTWSALPGPASRVPIPLAEGAAVNQGPHLPTPFLPSTPTPQHSRDTGLSLPVPGSPQTPLP